ncbi:MAG: hypothetical protein ABFS43_11890, partial [Thermodesulfobacteriota bacterium]
DPSCDLTTFICNDDLSFHEIVEILIRFYRGIDNPPTKRVLWNLSDASMGSLSMEEIRQIANLSIDNEEIMRDGKTAIVAPRDIDFGLARVLAAWTTGSHSDLMVFRTLNEATEWLEIE